MDEGFVRGQEISPYYDPMLGKLIVWAGTRSEACCKMSRALSEIRIAGVSTTIPVCKSIIDHPLFRSGDYCTHTLEEILPEMNHSKNEITTEYKKIAAASIAVDITSNPSQIIIENSSSAWVDAGRFEELE